MTGQNAINKADENIGIIHFKRLLPWEECFFRSKFQFDQDDWRHFRFRRCRRRGGRLDCRQRLKQFFLLFGHRYLEPRVAGDILETQVIDLHEFCDWVEFCHNVGKILDSTPFRPFQWAGNVDKANLCQFRIPGIELFVGSCISRITPKLQIFKEFSKRPMMMMMMKVKLIDSLRDLKLG